MPLLRHTVFLLVILRFAGTASGDSLPPLLNVSLLPPVLLDEDNEITLKSQVSFPEGSEPTRTAPSKISLYEKKNSQWTIVGRRSVPRVLNEKNTLLFDESFTVSSRKAGLTYDAVIYYCSKKGGACSFRSYRGAINRVSGNTHGTSLDLKVSLPPIGRKTKE